MKKVTDVGYFTEDVCVAADKLESLTVSKEREVLSYQYNHWSKEFAKYTVFERNAGRIQGYCM